MPSSLSRAAKRRLWIFSDGNRRSATGRKEMVSGGRPHTPVLKKRAYIAEDPVGQLERTGRFDDVLGAEKLALDAMLAVVALALFAQTLSIGAAGGAVAVTIGEQVNPFRQS